jgi:hypothetical protein
MVSLCAVGATCHLSPGVDLVLRGTESLLVLCKSLTTNRMFLSFAHPRNVIGRKGN